MIRTVQDFYSNFNNAIIAKDTNLTMDMLINELSTLIVKSKPRVVEMMNAAGVPVSKNISDTALANRVIDNAEKNNKVRHGIAYLISEKHDLLNYSNNTGGDILAGIKAGGSGGTPADPVSAIAAGVGSIFGFLKSHKDAKAAKAEAKSQLAMQILAQKGGSKMSTGAWIGIGVGVAALLGTVVFFATRKS